MHGSALKTISKVAPTTCVASRVLPLALQTPVSIYVSAEMKTSIADSREARSAERNYNELQGKRPERERL